MPASAGGFGADGGGGGGASGSSGGAGTRLAARGSALERLLARREPIHVEFGLGRIRTLLDRLDHPERRYRAIHVAGTNGKGSVAATADSILRAAGRRTGLYTSPHLFDFAERIRIGGRPADSELLEAGAAEILPLADELDATFFEATTALAFLAFARAAVDAAVVEVGLGGRLDATNVLAAGVAVITSIDLDHAAYLGTDPAGIAREKAGIVTEGSALLVGDVTGAASRELQLVAERSGARRLSLNEAFAAEGVRETKDGVTLTYRSEARPDGLLLRSPLRGAHQAANVATAVAAVDEFTRDVPGGDLVASHAVRAGVADVRWPGRVQVERGAGPGDPTFVYDIAHNPAAARVLAATLGRWTKRGELARPLVLVAAVLGDKDWRAMLGPLLEACDAAVLTDAPSAPAARRWELHAAAAAVAGRFSPSVVPDFGTALAEARRRACAEGGCDAGRPNERDAPDEAVGTVVVTGSCYTVADALRAAGRHTGR